MPGRVFEVGPDIESHKGLSDGAIGGAVVEFGNREVGGGGWLAADQQGLGLERAEVMRRLRDETDE